MTSDLYKLLQRCLYVKRHCGCRLNHLWDKVKVSSTCICLRDKIQIEAQVERYGIEVALLECFHEQF